MPRPLNEQVVVITGASSGIGREAARKFGKAGASVVLAARNEEALHEAAEEVRASGGQARVVPTDVADWEQVKRLVDEAFNTFGRIDTWVNDAAVTLYATVDDTTIGEFQRVMQVNYMSQVYGVKAVLPYTQRQGQGTIINIGSIESVRSLPYQAAYAASKHAVKGFTESLRMKLKRDRRGIEVTLIMPAGINTPLFNHARSKLGVKPRPLPPAYKPKLVAGAIVYAAQHTPRDIYVGGASMMFSLMERLSPALAVVRSAGNITRGRLLLPLSRRRWPARR